jgi:hypothetical protein
MGHKGSRDGASFVGDRVARSRSHSREGVSSITFYDEQKIGRGPVARRKTLIKLSTTETNK